MLYKYICITILNILIFTNIPINVAIYSLIVMSNADLGFNDQVYK